METIDFYEMILLIMPQPGDNFVSLALDQCITRARVFDPSINIITPLHSSGR